MVGRIIPILNACFGLTSKVPHDTMCLLIEIVSLQEMPYIIGNVVFQRITLLVK